MRGCTAVTNNTCKDRKTPRSTCKFSGVISIHACHVPVVIIIMGAVSMTHLRLKQPHPAPSRRGWDRHPGRDLGMGGRGGEGEPAGWDEAGRQPMHGMHGRGLRNPEILQNEWEACFLYVDTVIWSIAWPTWHINAIIWHQLLPRCLWLIYLPRHNGGFDSLVVGQVLFVPYDTPCYRSSRLAFIADHLSENATSKRSPVQMDITRGSEEAQCNGRSSKNLFTQRAQAKPYVLPINPMHIAQLNPVWKVP